MNARTGVLILAMGSLSCIALESTVEAGRHHRYRCQPRTSWWQWQPRTTTVAPAAPAGTYYYQDAQGTYRRYSFEPGEEGTTTPAPAETSQALPREIRSTPAVTPTRSGSGVGDIQNRRQRPGQGFRP